jgi:hypothetical protein
MAGKFDELERRFRALEESFGKPAVGESLEKGHSTPPDA